jgi:Leucine-rich repeat (LRR) protein
MCSSHCGTKLATRGGLSPATSHSAFDQRQGLDAWCVLIFFTILVMRHVAALLLSVRLLKLQREAERGLLLQPPDCQDAHMQPQGQTIQKLTLAMCVCVRAGLLEVVRVCGRHLAKFDSVSLRALRAVHGACSDARGLILGLMTHFRFREVTNAPTRVDLDTLRAATSTTHLSINSNQLQDVHNNLRDSSALHHLQHLRFLSVRDGHPPLESGDTVEQHLSELIRLVAPPNARAGRARKAEMFTNLERLDLHCSRLSELPGNITTLSNLTSLDLSGSQLCDAPEAVAMLEQLQVLGLARNDLRDLPSCYSSLGSVSELSLASNHLSGIPPVLATMSALRVLDISSNDLPAPLDSLSHLAGVEALTMYECGFPESVCQLSGLRSLALSEHVMRDSDIPLELPAALGNLQRLTGFTAALAGTGLGWWDEDLGLQQSSRVGQLSALQALDLKGRYINVQACHIKVLDPSISNLTRLTSLNLGGYDMGSDDLELLPDAIVGLGSLVELLLPRNKLWMLPVELGLMTSLRKINLACNCLQPLPDSISCLTNLDGLDVSRNELTVRLLPPHQAVIPFHVLERANDAPSRLLAPSQCD